NEIGCDACVGKKSESTASLLKPDIGPQSSPSARAAIIRYAPPSGFHPRQFLIRGQPTDLRALRIFDGSSGWRYVTNGGMRTTKRRSRKASAEPSRSGRARAGAPTTEHTAKALSAFTGGFTK